MRKQYSISEARRNLPRLLDEAASGAAIELTRRGDAVAVLIPVHEYRRLTATRPSFREAYAAFRERFDLEEVGVDPDFADQVRDRSTGRDVEL